MDSKLLEEKIKQWELQIRQGQFASVRSDLLRLPLAQIPRVHAATIAAKANRAGLPYWANRLLGPLVRPEIKTSPKASAAEIMAYAASLFRIGIVQEGFDLLHELDPRKHPEALLHEAFGRYRQWDYVTGVALLKKFLRLTSANDYFAIVGQVNLAAGLIFLQQYDQAEKKISFLLNETQEKKLHLLHGNSLELLAQVRIFQGRHDEAREILLKSNERLEASQGTYNFFVRKWMVINQWLQQKTPNSETHQALQSLRNQALQARHWETYRDCDYYEALRTKDSSLIARLSFGTPHLGFRRRLSQIFGDSARRQGSYSWSLGEEPNSALNLIIDPSAAFKTKADVTGELSPTLRRMWLALCKDFYRPVPLGEIFAEAFPGEFFNAISSPPRVAANVKRLREWFKQHQLPLQIEIKNKEFRLTAAAGCTLLIHASKQLPSPHELHLIQLKQKMKTHSFTIATAAEILNVSISTVQRALLLGIKNKTLIKIGRGRGCRYRFGRTPRNKASEK